MQSDFRLSKDMPFLILFVVIPVIEIYIFLLVGGWIGAGWTALACLATAFLGGWMVRAQGMETFRQGQTNLQRGVLPVRELFHGFCLIVAGALLLTPGFMTDLFGLLLLMPIFRKLIQDMLQKYPYFQTKYGRRARDDGVIEGEYETVKPTNIPLNKNEQDKTTNK
jgi:UPF0716 protein FxsA